jgi:hypothetical protein
VFSKAGIFARLQPVQDLFSGAREPRRNSRSKEVELVKMQSANLKMKNENVKFENEPLYKSILEGYFNFTL